MNHLLHDHDVVRGLHDLDVVVVGAREHRQRSRDAPLPQAAILRVVGVGRDQSPRVGACRLALLRLGRQRRDPAVRRIDDERGLTAEDARAAVPPEVVVGPRDVGIGAGALAAVLISPLERCSARIRRLPRRN